MSFKATVQEQQIIDAVLAKADPSGIGIVTTEEAADIFHGSGLPYDKFDEIWTLLDDVGVNAPRTIIPH